MIAEQMIDSYVADVVTLLPRNQRRDVAQELRALLTEPQESWVVGEQAGLAVELADIDDVGPDAAAVDRKIEILVSDRQCGGLIAWFCVHQRSPMYGETGRTRKAPKQILGQAGCSRRYG